MFPRIPAYPGQVYCYLIRIGNERENNESIVRSFGLFGRSVLDKKFSEEGLLPSEFRAEIVYEKLSQTELGHALQALRVVIP